MNLDWAPVKEEYANRFSDLSLKCAVPSEGPNPSVKHNILRCLRLGFLEAEALQPLLPERPGRVELALGHIELTVNLWKPSRAALRELSRTFRSQYVREYQRVAQWYMKTPALNALN